MTSGNTNSSEPNVVQAKASLKARLPIWLMFGGGGIFAVLIILGVAGTIMQKSELPECDSQKARDTMSDVFNEQFRKARTKWSVRRALRSRVAAL